MPLPRMNNIFKLLDIEQLQPLQKSILDIYYDSKPYLNDYVEKIDASVGTLNDTSAYKSRVALLLNSPEDGSVRALYEDIDASVKTQRLASYLDSSNLTDKQLLRNAKSFSKQMLRSLEHSIKQNYRVFEQGVIKDFEKSGIETMEAFKLLLKAPQKFSSLYGVDIGDFAARLYDGQTEFNDPVLNNIGNNLLNAQAKLLEDFKKTGAFVRPHGSFFLNATLTPEHLTLIGRERLYEALTTLTKNTEEQIEARLTSLEKPKYGTKDLVEDFRTGGLEFKSGKEFIEFKRLLDKDEGVENIFHEFFLHKQRQIRTAQIQFQFGNRPADVLANAIGHSRLQLGKKLDERLTQNYKALTKSLTGQIQLLAGQKFIDDAFMHNIGSIVNQTMSIVTAAPARSTIRNLFIDYEANALAVGNSLYNDKYEIGGTAQRIFRNFSYLVSQAIGNPKQKQAVEDILSVAGWANSMDGLTFSNILAFEDVLTANPDLGSEAVRTQWFNQQLSRVQSSLFRLSGNHALIDFVRARRFVSLQQMFSTVLKHNSFDEWMESLPVRQKNELQFLSDRYGLDREAFEFLKVAKKAKINIDNHVTRGLHFGKVPEYISRDSILETPDSVVKPFLKKGQDATLFKEQMATNWQRFVYNALTAFAPVPTVADSVSAPIATNLPSWTVLGLRPFLKFADVANAQWTDLAERIAIQIYGDTSKYIGLDGSLPLYGKALTLYLGATAAHVWVKDLLNNREPTDFKDVEASLRLFAMSGFGGYHTMVGANALGLFPTAGRSIYKMTPLGAGVNDIKAIGKAFKESDSRLGHLGIALHKANPYTQLWYASGLVDTFLTNILLSPREKRKRYRNYEEYGKPYLF